MVRMLICFLWTIVFTKKHRGSKSDNFSPDFAFRLSEEVLPEDKNSCISPLSLQSCFALVYPASAGQTQTEMQDTFDFKPKPDLVFQDFSTLSEKYDLLSKQKPYYGSISPTIGLTNRLYIADDPLYALQSDYSKLVQDLATKIDFRDPSASDEINKWVAGKTRGLIKKTIGELDPQTLSVVVSTLFFNATWANPFSKWNTRPSPFFADPERKIAKPFQANLMSLHEKFLPYFEDSERQIVSLPFDGCKISMVIDLPKHANAPFLNVVNFEGAMRSMREVHVDVELPKFKFESTYTTSVLKRALETLGLKRAFGSHADFPGFGGASIDSIIHKTVIDVNEKGTTAAAVTAMAMNAMSVIVEQPKKFVADHPFSFYLWDSESEAMLFMGRVYDPTDSQLTFSIDGQNGNSYYYELKYAHGFALLGIIGFILMFGMIITGCIHCQQYFHKQTYTHSIKLLNIDSHRV